jgi:hypothetical protein
LLLHFLFEEVMDTYQAMAMSDLAAEKGAKQMIFDWHKAAQLIKERQPKVASAGLKSDWEYTGGVIYTAEDGIKAKEYTYLSSNWATPELNLDGEIIPCFIDQDHNPDGWDSSTSWPDVAVAILNGTDEKQT